MNEYQKNACCKIMDHFGLELQLAKTGEELGELSAEISKVLLQVLRGVPRRQTGAIYIERRNELAEEIADVEIMLEQIKHELNLSGAVGVRIDEKLRRTEDFIKNEPQKGGMIL